MAWPNYSRACPFPGGAPHVADALLGATRALVQGSSMSATQKADLVAHIDLCLADNLQHGLHGSKSDQRKFDNVCRAHAHLTAGGANYLLLLDELTHSVGVPPGPIAQVQATPAGGASQPPAGKPTAPKPKPKPKGDT